MVELLNSERMLSLAMAWGADICRQRKVEWPNAPGRWYRLRAEWLAAAIEELGGEPCVLELPPGEQDLERLRRLDAPDNGEVTALVKETIEA